MYYRKILLVQEEEKKRLSRDLHDEAGQIVIALGASLNAMEKALKAGESEKVLALVDDSRKLIQEIAGKMKAMALNLRPPALDLLGLSAVLREYFSQCTTSWPIRIEFTENLKGAKLGENIEIAVYRIVQEAIYNVQKHASATKVKADLIVEGKELALHIRDNGAGFDWKEYQKHPDPTKLGLCGLRERAERLERTFSIVSAPGKGTKLTVTLPL